MFGPAIPGIESVLGRAHPDDAGALRQMLEAAGDPPDPSRLILLQPR